MFVKAVGFGALAGILALTVASIGFAGKLFAEAIEEISPRQVEAVRATGASFAGVIAFGVMPQVFSRFIGFATYQVDANLRDSTMVGIAGAGRASVLRYGYWPHLKPSFWAVALSRWDVNVRESSVLGIVGAGGIGMALDTAMNLFQWRRVAVILAAIFLVVVLAEMAVTAIRRRVL